MAYGFNSYDTYMPRQQFQPYQMQPQFPPQQPQGLIRVTGIDGAKAYQMPPNSVTALFDGESDVFYVKSTDGAGFPTIKAFAFSPLEAVQPQSDFVTRQEFEELKGMILNGKQSVRKSKSAAPASTTAEPEE